MAEASHEGDEQAQTTRIQLLESHIDNLTEKRTSTREEALDAILKGLRLYFEYDLLEKRKETLTEAIKKAFKKGSLKEKQISCDILSLIFITLGADSEDLYKEFKPIFEENIKNDSNKEAQSSFINSYAMAAFIGNPDEKVTISNLEFLHAIFHGNMIASFEAIESALKGWALLLTTVQKSYIYDHSIPTDTEIFIDYLKSEDVDIRVAAGECLALLFEAAMNHEEDFDLQAFGNDFGIDVDNLLDLLHGLSADKTKTRAKKDKSKQRVPFKEILNYIENGEEPSESLVFKFQKFNFGSWTELIQLEALREVLGEGLQNHFESNQLLHQIFNLTLDKNAKKLQLSAIEKRLFMSPSSSVKKANTKYMNKQRNEKQTPLDFGLGE